MRPPAAEPVGDGRRDGPEHEKRRCDRQRVGRARGDGHGDHARDDRAGAISATNRRSRCPTSPAVRAAVGGGRFPLEHPAPGDDEAHQGDADGMRRIERMEGEKRQAERGSGPARCAVSRRRLRRKTGTDCARPGPTSSRATTGSSCDAVTPITLIVQNQREPGSTVHPATSSSQQRRCHEAAPQVVQDLPAPDDRQGVALEAVARRARTGTARTESASRHGSSGAAAARGTARSTGTRPPARRQRPARRARAAPRTGRATEARSPAPIPSSDAVNASTSYSPLPVKIPSPKRS